MQRAMFYLGQRVIHDTIPPKEGVIERLDINPAGQEEAFILFDDRQVYYVLLVQLRAKEKTTRNGA